ncbi:MAG: hypothetical protein RI957_1856 [Verrucomicrobiota bacterium]|jgi:hypothetical protein
MKWFYRAWSTHAIRFASGTAHSVKGKLLRHALTDLAAILSEHEVREGEIWMNARGKVRFSPEIPAHLHQRLRNIILS